MQKQPASYWIEKLQLQKHIEGGSFREVYRSSLILEKNNLPDTFNGSRNSSTSIYFLLEYGQFSALHRIASDELWHFYYGDALTVYEIDAITGELLTKTLGSNIENGEVFQVAVKAGNWFGAAITNGGGYALVGCTVSPGFDFADFELAQRAELIEQYPQHAVVISSLTR
ncbi:MAG: cupin domain-containing protein [Bacteroidetes bacterium]|nr:cupin domain-containing protein [Bacteroidota bacterium]